MPMTPKPSVVRTDAAGLAAFEGDALLVLEISKREIETYASGQPILNLVSGLSKIVCT